MAYLSDLRGFVLGVLVVPVLKVLVNGSLLRVCALAAQDGAETTSCLCGLAVQRLVEGCVAAVIFGLESVWCHYYRIVRGYRKKREQLNAKRWNEQKEGPGNVQRKQETINDYQLEAYKVTRGEGAIWEIIMVRRARALFSTT